MTNGKKIGIFLAAAFALPFLCIPLERALTGLPAFLVYGFRAAAPSVAALAVLALSGRLRAWAKRFFRKGDLCRAVLFPVLCAFALMAAASLFSGGHALSRPGGKRLVMILWALVAEEAGWRGFLEPALTERTKSDVLAPLVTGLVWCLWHAHYWVTDGLDVPLALFVAGCVAESFLYSALVRFAGGRLAAAMCFHFAWNLFYHVCGVSGSPAARALLTGIEAAAAAVIIAVRLRKKHILSDRK